MKYISFIATLFVAFFLTSCAELLQLADYTVDEWTKTMPADSYDHTYTDAWQSGTGGKALAISQLGVSVIGGLTGKDVSGLKNVIHGAASNLVSNEGFNNNDVGNWFGAMLCTGDELIKYHRNQKFEEEVRRLTDPSALGYDPEEALAVADIDYANGKIIWKSNNEWIRDIIDYRNSQQNTWLDSNLETVCDITLDEYNALSKEDRYNVDIKLLNNRYKDITTTTDNVVESKNTPPVPTEKISPSYNAEIESFVISQYDFNSAKLSDEQMDALHKIGKYMKDDSTISVKIIGHTCSIGSEASNYNIGQKRAEEAKKYLVAQGVNAERIYTESAGYSNPIASNDTLEGRKANRRITFEIVH